MRKIKLRLKKVIYLDFENKKISPKTTCSVCLVVFSPIDRVVKHIKETLSLRVFLSISSYCVYNNK